MADVYKILGQSAPSATTATDVYTVGATTSAIISTITVCNRSSTVTDTFRIAILQGGGTVATTDYIAYDAVIGVSDFLVITLGIGLATTDQVEVYAGTANLTFQVFGMEIT